MYSTSSEHTRVPWAAHTYNVAFADEIGHFELCDQVDGNGNCVTAGADEPTPMVDGDDVGCFPASPSFGYPISGCLGEDLDFDGLCYGLRWPGTLADASTDLSLHGTPIRFTGPLFNGSRAYERVAFETDLPSIESVTNTACSHEGVGCVNPPVGASFYPIFTTWRDGEDGQCHWQLGGPSIPGTIDTFGGTSTAEYGDLQQLTYAKSLTQPLVRYEDFRRVLSYNPCGAGSSR
jgi:hypothetical protein